MSITPDKQDIYITVNVTEGEKYTVSDVQLEGDYSCRETELETLVQLKPGDVFSREKLAETTKAITDRLGNVGYAFANVNADPGDRPDKRTRRASPSSSTRAGASTCAASTSPATRRRATK